MKNFIRFVLFKIRLYPILNLIRNLPKIFSWINNGCCGAAPTPIKWMVLSSYIKKYKLNGFIETGTHFGDTLEFIARKNSIKAISIEIDPFFFKRAKARFNSFKNVQILNGDSGELIFNVVENLKEPALFWLDGHYSGANTGKGSCDTPISKELQAIFKSPVAGHVILIDDARYFNGENDYPKLEELLNNIREKGLYKIEVSIDIIRLTPVGN